jgi:hypothetical protein
MVGIRRPFEVICWRCRASGLRSATSGPVNFKKEVQRALCIQTKPSQSKWMIIKALIFCADTLLDDEQYDRSVFRPVFEIMM